MQQGKGDQHAAPKLWWRHVQFQLNLLHPRCVVVREPGCAVDRPASWINCILRHHFDSILRGVVSAAFSAGFTAVDTLAFGALGHMAGVGIVLGLRATGAI